MDKLKSEVELCKSSLHSKVQSTEWWWDEDWMLEVLKFKCSRWRWRNNKNWWNANSYTMSTSLNTLPRLLLYLNLLLLPLLSLSILHDLQQRDDDVLVVRFPLERSLDAIIQDLSFWLIYPAIQRKPHFSTCTWNYIYLRSAVLQPSPQRVASIPSHSHFIAN